MILWQRFLIVSPMQLYIQHIPTIRFLHSTSHSNKKTRKNVISSHVALALSSKSRVCTRNDDISVTLSSKSRVCTRNDDISRFIAEFLYSASISMTISLPGLSPLLVARKCVVSRCVPRVFRGLRILGFESRYNLENLLSRGAHSALISRPRGASRQHSSH